MKVLFLAGLILLFPPILLGSSPADSSKVSLTDTLQAEPDSTEAQKARTQKTKDFPVYTKIENHRVQIITSAAVMSSLIVIMALMNNYNPR